jgi:hypothetical protein
MKEGVIARVGMQRQQEERNKDNFESTFFVHLYTYFCTAHVHGYLTKTISRNPSAYPFVA